MSEGPTLRTLLEQLNLEQFVLNCVKKTGLPKEQVEDETLFVLEQILSREEDLRYSFQHMTALFRYMFRAVVRRVVNKRPELQTSVEQLMSVQSDSPTPEQQLMQRLLHQSLQELVEQILTSVPKGQRKGYVEVQQLLKRLLKSPDRFIHTRQSGKDKGNLTFDISGLAKELEWTRHKVYDRLQQLRQLMSKHQSLLTP